MCVLSYALQAKIIAAIELLTSIFSLFAITTTTLVIELDSSVQDEIEHKGPYNVFNIFQHFPISEKVPLVVLPILYFIGEFILAVWLYKSVNERNYKRCRAWYIVTITVCLTGFYFFIPGIFFTEDSYYYIVIFLASYAFTLYSVWVVHCFMNELKSEGLHKPIIQYEDEMDKL